MVPEGSKLLGERLVARGLITKQELMKALDACQETDQPLGKVLISKGYVTEHDLVKALGKKIDSSRPISLTHVEIAPDVIAKIPPSVVQIYKIVPLEFKGNELTIAMADPFNIQIIDDLKFRLGYEVKGMFAEEKEIKQAIAKYYGHKGDSFEDVLGVIKDRKEESVEHAIKAAEENLDAVSLKELANQAPVIKLLNLVLMQAVKDQASDIHLEPFETDFKVRYRVDGILYEMSPPPKSLALALTSRIKVMANLDISERRLPQDGRIIMKIGDKNVDLRVSTLPTAYGESVVIRVLDKSIVSLSLDQIGMRAETLADFRKIIQKPNGIVLVTGPTGSGKTTTLYSALREINKIETKIITTEDPVEYDIDGLIQIPINSKIDLSFARCLRAILRQDPDVIMVGEIRDEETAQIAVQSSLTGHLVFSTLHTNDAPGAVTRLLDMGVEPFLITSSLEAILAQRLVRTVCTRCKEAYAPSEENLRELGLDASQISQKQFFRGKGCPACNHTGYKGRTGIFELFVMNDVIRALVLERAATVALRQKAQEMGMRTLREYGILKIFDGETTPEEVIRETQLYN
jgi:type IV pilus assembly protein PilB